MKFAHRNCGEIVVEYVGTMPLEVAAMILDDNWLILDKPPSHHKSPFYICPNCNLPFGINPGNIFPIADDAP